MKKFIIIFILGAFSSMAMAPLNLWPALFIGLSALYILLVSSKTPMKAALTGFGFSLGYFVFGLSWIGNALLVEDNPYWWAWPLAVSGLPLVLSLFTATACFIYKKISKDRNNWASYILFVLLMTASDYARGHLFTGFPWNLYGYTWIDVLPIAQIASLYDIYLLTLLTIFWASAPAFLITANHNRNVKIISALGIAITLISGYMFGELRINAYHPAYLDDYKIVIIQPNIKQNEKWDPEKIAGNYVQQIEQSKYSPPPETTREDGGAVKAYYIIWPETAISTTILNTPWARDMIKEMLNTYPTNAYLITGALRYEEETKSYFNSIIMINKDTEIIETYNKSHLVPFGEYMPLENILDIAPIVGFTGFKKGIDHTPMETPESLRLSPLICYEIIFSGRSINKDMPTPNAILNLSNDGWYGKSAGPYQHLVQAQFRAIETGIPVIRSANTGISAIISPIGKVEISGALLENIKITQKLPISFAQSK